MFGVCRHKTPSYLVLHTLIGFTIALILFIDSHCQAQGLSFVVSITEQGTIVHDDGRAIASH